jgi:amino acid adenylation domain-containing protein
VQKNINISLEIGAEQSDVENSKSPKKVLGDSDFLTESEIHQLLIEWNDTDALYSSQYCIHQLFEAHVEKTPDAIAVVYAGQQLSYKELNQRANQLAHYLIEKGVKPDNLVGIFLERSFEMVVAILGILKAGGAYVPLDPDYPKARLEYMRTDANLSIVLTKIHYEERINGGENGSVCLDDANTILTLSQYSKKNPNVNELGLTPSNLAYVIYTSGSTGNPKGVMIEHTALVNRIEWMVDQYGCDSSDVILQKTPFSFDVSVWEFFLPLISGASIVMALSGGHKDPIYLSTLIQNEMVTKLHFVPSMLNAMLSSTKLAECISLKQVFCSGEALLPNYVGVFYKQGIQAELHNLYGPTEASIDVSYWACSENDAIRSGVPIGRPIDNIQLYIFDEQLRLTAPGVEGELHIGGVGLARGYMNRPELTAEKFISNPFSDDSRKRLYKTGDLCRYLPDGNIEFLGRIDHQVKIRGFRIELGEIENVLIKHDVVSDAVVLSKDLPTGGNCLVAYIVPNVEPVISELRKYLEDNLPDYMIPSAFVVLSELPLTANGKVDRKVLLAKEIYRASKAMDGSADMSFLQNKVYKIWQQILGFDDFDVDEDLFKVGGDSIAAIQIFTAVNEEFGVNIYMEELFSNDNFSIRWLADLIEKYQINLLGEEGYSTLLDHINGLSEEEIAALLLD